MSNEGYFQRMLGRQIPYLTEEMSKEDEEELRKLRAEKKAKEEKKKARAKKKEQKKKEALARKEKQDAWQEYVSDGERLAG